jgi:short-subunit dehydrogenase
LARQCARNGFDLVIVADEAEILDATRRLEAEGATVEALQADLSTTEGVDRWLEAASGRPIDALLANAGRGLGKAAHIMLVRLTKWSWLKAWAMKIARHRGIKKAIVALARRLAVIMHRIWVDGSEFRWTRVQATAAA